MPPKKSAKQAPSGTAACTTSPFITRLTRQQLERLVQGGGLVSVTGAAEAGQLCQLRGCADAGQHQSSAALEPAFHRGQEGERGAWR